MLVRDGGTVGSEAPRRGHVSQCAGSGLDRWVPAGSRAWVEHRGLCLWTLSQRQGAGGCGVEPMGCPSGRTVWAEEKGAWRWLQFLFSCLRGGVGEVLDKFDEIVGDYEQISFDIF